MPRRYIHSTEIGGASVTTDANELQFLTEQAVGLGLTIQIMEDELVKRTGFEVAVRGWLRLGQIPNGLVRRIILNSARQIIDDNQP